MSEPNGVDHKVNYALCLDLRESQQSGHYVIYV